MLGKSLSWSTSRRTTTSMSGSRDQRITLLIFKNTIKLIFEQKIKEKVKDSRMILKLFSQRPFHVKDAASSRRERGSR